MNSGSAGGRARHCSRRRAPWPVIDQGQLPAAARTSRAAATPSSTPTSARRSTTSSSAAAVSARADRAAGGLDRCRDSRLLVAEIRRWDRRSDAHCRFLEFVGSGSGTIRKVRRRRHPPRSVTPGRLEGTPPARRRSAGRGLAESSHRLVSNPGSYRLHQGHHSVRRAGNERFGRTPRGRYRPTPIAPGVRRLDNNHDI